jgi:hypothetical protein
MNVPVKSNDRKYEKGKNPDDNKPNEGILHLCETAHVDRQRKISD